MKKIASPIHRSTLVAVCLALMIYTVAWAASGDLDTTFSGDGMIIQGFGGTEHGATDVAVQADGKVVAVGDKVTAAGRDFAIARYNPDGSLDPTFSGDGRQVVDIGVMDQANGVAIQADGRIVVGGQTCNSDHSLCDVAFARLSADGRLDPSLSGDGKVVTDFGAGDNGGADLIMQGNKILVIGYSHNGASYNATVYRYLSNGSLDATFSGDGILPINFGAEDYLTGVALYSGKIYVTGYSQTSDYSLSDIIAARLNSNGTLDITFSGDGRVKTNLGTNDYGFDLAVSGGKVIVVGKSDSNIAIVQYTATGALDPAFSGDGILKSNLGLLAPWLTRVVIQAGKIVAVGGTGGSGLLVRFTAAGDPDFTFSGDGIATTDWAGGNDYYSSAAIKNGRYYVVGTSVTAADVLRFIVAAYQP